MSAAHSGASDVGAVFTSATFWRELDILLKLRTACPAYEFWWESRRLAPPVFVAKRRPGATSHPHTLVTRDITEIRAALEID